MKIRELETEVNVCSVLNETKIKVDDRFNILVYNLISNAIKYTNGGIIKIKAKILEEV